MPVFSKSFPVFVNHWPFTNPCTDIREQLCLYWITRCWRLFCVSEVTTCCVLCLG
jgi:hypothetical protein